jgi:hypothetical protein
MSETATSRTAKIRRFVPIVIAFYRCDFILIAGEENKESDSFVQLQAGKYNSKDRAV